MSEQRINLPTSAVTEEQVDVQMGVILPEIDPDIMRKYIAYARKNVYPILEDNAHSHLIDFYMSLRKMGEGTNSPVPVTARQLEALVRLTEASARVRLSNVATIDDAIRTTGIVYSSLEQVGIDPDTGMFDVDVLTSGTSKSQRDKIKIIKDIIRMVGSQNPGGKAPLEDIFIEAEKEQIDRVHAEELITKMLGKGDLLKPDNTHVRLV
jgi:replicative DNA helicase Mcm